MISSLQKIKSKDKLINTSQEIIINFAKLQKLLFVVIILRNY